MCLPPADILQRCLAQYCKRRLWKFLDDLQQHRVWFFALYEASARLLCSRNKVAALESMLHLGTCAMISKDAKTSVGPGVPFFAMLHAQYGEVPDLDFSVHEYLPPCIPILPEVVTEPDLLENAYDGHTFQYVSLYDGLFIVNPVTMFAIQSDGSEWFRLGLAVPARSGVFVPVVAKQMQFEDVSCQPAGGGFRDGGVPFADGPHVPHTVELPLHHGVVDGGGPNR